MGSTWSFTLPSSSTSSPSSSAVASVTVTTPAGRLSSSSLAPLPSSLLASIPISATVPAANAAAAIRSSSPRPFRVLASREIQSQHINFGQFLLCMPASSLAIRFCLFPINVIKTRMQAEPHHPHFPPPTSASASGHGHTSHSHSHSHSAASSSITANLRTIVKHEGLRGLWSGYMTAMIGTFFAPAYLFGLEYSKAFLVRSGFHAASPFTTFTSGFCGAAISQIFFVPFDVLSQHLQLQGRRRVLAASTPTSASAASPTQTKPTSALALAKILYQQQGLRGLYSGYALGLSYFGTFNGILWTVYEPMTATLRPYLEDSKSSEHWYYRSFFSDPRLHFSFASFTLTAVSGGFASAISCVVTAPLDIIKTKIQTSEGKLKSMDAVKQIVKTNGVKGLYAGMTARIASAPLQSALLYSSYEIFKRYCALPAKLDQIASLP